MFILDLAFIQVVPMWEALWTEKKVQALVFGRPRGVGANYGGWSMFECREIDDECSENPIGFMQRLYIYLYMLGPLVEFDFYAKCIGKFLQSSHG